MDNQIMMSTFRREDFMEMITEGVKNGLSEALINALNPKEQMFTINEAAKHCKVTARTIHNWTNQGVIKAHKIGGRTLYKETQLNEAIKGRTVYKQR